MMMGEALQDAMTHDVLKVVDGELWSEELRKRIPRKISKNLWESSSLIQY